MMEVADRQRSKDQRDGRRRALARTRHAGSVVRSVPAYGPTGQGTSYI